MSEEHSGNSIALAALLHDIGKFKQRAGIEDDAGKTHVQIGYDWLKSFYGEGLVTAAARNHHGSEKEAWESNLGLIFYEADNCAAAERKTSFDPRSDLDAHWHREIQLANVFSRVQDPRPQSSADTSVKTKAPPGSFNPLTTVDHWNEPAAAEGKNSKEEYHKLWDRFEEEFKSLHAAGCHHNVEAVLHLLEKYTSFIPSITLKVRANSEESTYRKHPDVSLFDHLRVTAATAVCLARYHSSKQPDRWETDLLKEEITGEKTWTQNESSFLLIGGDISGVQKFLYTISSKGALKALKGRSFFLELLTEHAVDRLIKEMGLARPNVIFTGGGHFYLLGPNTPSIPESIAKVRREINDYLFDAFGASLQLLIESFPFGKADFEDASKIWTNLAAKIEESKRQKWKNRVGQLFGDPKMPHMSCETTNCAVCGREDLQLIELNEEEPDVLVCQHCMDQYRLGALIQSTVRHNEWPVISRWEQKPDSRRCVQLGNCFYQFESRASMDTRSVIGGPASAVFHMNDWDLKNFTHPVSRPLLAGTYLPEDESCLELEGMASEGFGIGLLAALRMDVDNLGRIFSTAVPQEERTFSRMASISRQLNLFFKYHINNLMEMRPGYPTGKSALFTTGERRLSIVYAGGDDLFLIGHWLDATRAAFDINAAFGRYTANPYMTISAGLALGGSHDPVYHLADEAGEAEKQAKNAGKQSITLFNKYTFPWDEAARARDLLEKISGLFGVQNSRLRQLPGSIASGTMYRLLSIAREHKTEGKWILPKLAYLFGRVKPTHKDSSEIWAGLKNYVFSKDVKWRQLEVAILWCLMLMRRGEA